MKDNNPQPEQIEALLSRLRGIAGRMTRIQLGKLSRVTDAQLILRLTRNIGQVDPDATPREVPTNGTIEFTLTEGGREYQFIQYWEAGRDSFNLAEMLAKAKDLGADGGDDDLRWCQANAQLIGELLPGEGWNKRLVFTGANNRGRPSVPFILTKQPDQVCYRGTKTLWRLDRTWLVKRIK